MNYRSLSFPKHFAWGVATAAPQIEGAAFSDGKAPSVWDNFCRVPGKVADGGTLDVACDHYHRWREDVALIAQLGVKHYRLSIAWPRVLPLGRGAVNPQGLGFYNRLIDALLAEGITPWVTMFHWDLPQALEDEGGWRVRSTAEAFGAYADLLVKTYGDRVKHWITVNEMSCFTSLAYGGWGFRPPGTSEGEAVVNQTCHVALLAHGQGVRAVRQHGGRGAKVGFSDNTGVGIPFTETPEDIAAARAFFLEKQAQTQHPILTGSYSDDFLRKAGRHAPQVLPGDFELISAPMDFLGQNIYSGDYVRASDKAAYETIPWPDNFPAADAKWIRHVPQSLYWGTRLAAELYAPKAIYITENGTGWHDPAPTAEPADAALAVNDIYRREFARNYLGELRRAIQDGVPIRGYFHWSLLDNFEWHMGYLDRFGLVHVDFATGRRTPKLSAQWYARVVQENRLV